MKMAACYQNTVEYMWCIRNQKFPLKVYTTKITEKETNLIQYIHHKSVSEYLLMLHLIYIKSGSTLLCENN